VSLVVRDGSSITAWHNHHSANLRTGQSYKDEIGGTSVRYQREYIYIYIYIETDRERERERVFCWDKPQQRDHQEDLNVDRKKH